VDWQGQTLEQIAAWYTGKSANWEKLVRPVNPDLERCCVPLRVGREVTIPSTLLVRVEPMPKPVVTKKVKVTAPKGEVEAKVEVTTKTEEAVAAKVEPTVPEAAMEPAPEPAPSPEEPAAESSAATGGKVVLRGESWNVVDAIAFPDDDEIHVALTNKRFDRKALGKDGKIDSFDVMRHGGMESASSITLKIGADGPVGCIDFATQSGGGSSCNGAISEGFKLERNSKDAVAGRLAYEDGEDRVDVRFDVPVTATIERGGQKLPAGGGEPGKAVVENFAAIHAGDYERSKSLSHPEQRKMMEANEEESKQMFELMKAVTPTDVKILGGLVDGDTAVLDFEGKSDGQSVKGTIDVERYEGKWYVSSVNTSQ
jgi:hypothetical protein